MEEPKESAEKYSLLLYPECQRNRPPDTSLDSNNCYVKGIVLLLAANAKKNPKNVKLQQKTIDNGIKWKHIFVEVRINAKKS